jgi:hypothetical protein
MSTFLDTFPKIRYDITKSKLSTFDEITNITVRINVIKEVLDNISAYFTYDLSDGDTPEIIAEKLYRNPEAYWIILYANDMLDPQYDWPMNYAAFNNYIISKYGSRANATSTFHHYEKVITREVDNTITETRLTINKTNLANNSTYNNVFDYYDGLPEGGTYETFSVNGKTVVESINREAISNYDWEVSQNDARRSIKVIKPEYYPQIAGEFKNITGSNVVSFLRKLA